MSNPSDPGNADERPSTSSASSDQTASASNGDFPQVQAFLDETEALYQLLEGRDDEVYRMVTQFKDWTLHHVIAHLHIFNWAADLSMHKGDAFTRFYSDLQKTMASGGTMLQFTDHWLDQEQDGVRGRDLLESWHDFALAFGKRARTKDPRQRVQWAGPEMSIRSSVTARQMETWAHAQEIYDALGVERVEDDRIQNIVVLGIKTFGWTFVNRGLSVPEPAPYVRLTAPSGAVWEWNEVQRDNRVEGSAVEFCRVVTQTRNFADTQLIAVGDTATRWMSVAQCFAGPPMDPPAPGTRHPE